ncbi:MAG: nitroreductase family protein [Candidatus Heimdallarchaeota archaeon]|nr:nitroreductase family protein [Candidatus Heimdallarchaeota archaeon]MBY8993892.1 nitroreductase family protein [Candidatus Heimdallarchaeota archaeon]
MPNQNNEKQELELIILPEPDKKGGKTILEVLQLRQTNRIISSEELPIQILSNLLWAAFGVNREKTSVRNSGRTAPSASNSQEIDLYVVLKEGVYLYEVTHQLKLVLLGDYREMCSRWSAAERTGIAPLNIIYIADLSRYDLGPNQPDPHIGETEIQKSYYYTDTGFIAQNVYLFAASEGLAAWFHNCDKIRISKELKLRPEQIILFAHTIGFPEQRSGE